MDEYTTQETGGQPHDGPAGTPGVNGVTPAPLRATVSLLSEGRYECLRCGMRIDALAGYLDDANGRFIGVVHEKCVLPEELGGERPEPGGRRVS